MNEHSAEDGLNRRSYLTALVATGGLGSIGVADAGQAKADSDQIALRKEQQPASRASAIAARNSEYTQTLLSSLGDPDVRLEGAKRITLTIDGDPISHSILLPTPSGPIKINYEEERVLNGTVELTRETIPRGQRNRLSGRVGWPSGTAAALILHEPSATPRFVRTVTDIEREALINLTDETGDPISIGAVATPRGSGTAPEDRYVVTYQDASYTIGPSLQRVLDAETLGTAGGVSTQASPCVDKGSLCLIDIVMASPHCTLAGVACSITGPATLGCLVAVAGLCLPNVALVYVSGNCSYVVRNCL